MSASKSTAVSAWESLFRAQVTVMRRLSADFPRDEITLTEYDVLFNLSRADDRSLRLRDLVDELLITQPSVSRLVDRLVAKALITKRPDPTDARGVIVTLTDDGFDLFRRVAVAHMDSIANHVGGALTEKELTELEGLCTRLRSSVQGRSAR